MPISINRTVRLGTLVKEDLSLHVRMEWDWAEFVNTNVNFAQIATIVNAHQPNVTVNSDNNSDSDHSDSDAESDDQPEHEIIDISSDSDSDVEDSVSEETAPKRPKVEPNREVERPAALLIEPNNSAEGEMPIVEEEIDNFFTHLNSVPNVVERSAAQCEQPQGSRPQDPVPIGSREGGQMSPLSRYASVESDNVTSRKRPYVHQILPRGDVDERRRISVESDESDGEEIAEQIASVARAAKSHSERTRDEIRLINSFIEKMARSQVSRESGGSETECHPPSDPHQTDDSSVGSAQVANDCESQQQQPTTTIDGKIGVESINEQFRMFVNSYSATMADYSAAITGVAKEFLHVTQTVLMKEGQTNAETNNAGPSGQ